MGIFRRKDNGEGKRVNANGKVISSGAATSRKRPEAEGTLGSGEALRGMSFHSYKRDSDGRVTSFEVTSDGHTRRFQKEQHSPLRNSGAFGAEESSTDLNHGGTLNLAPEGPLDRYSDEERALIEAHVPQSPIEHMAVSDMLLPGDEGYHPSSPAMALHEIDAAQTRRNLAAGRAPFDNGPRGMSLIEQRARSNALLPGDEGYVRPDSLTMISVDIDSARIRRTIEAGRELSDNGPASARSSAGWKDSKFSAKAFADPDLPLT